MMQVFVAESGNKVLMFEPVNGKLRVSIALMNSEKKDAVLLGKVEKENLKKFVELL